MPDAAHASKRTILSVLMMLELISFTNLAQARDLRLDLPIGQALRDPAWRAGAAQGITFRFGAEPEGSFGDLSLKVTTSGFARPYVIVGGRSIRREDAPTCNDALRNTLAELAEQARKRGSNAVVNIVTSFQETPLNSKSEFTCNSGLNSGVIEVSAQFAVLRTDPSAQPESAQPRVISSPATGELVRTAARLPGTEGMLDARVFPPASKFAAIDDVEAIPYIGAGCKKHFTDEWLKWRFPRAFAVAPTGHCFGSWSYQPKNIERPKDPALRALEECKLKSGVDCQLYAVDDTVVFKHTGLDANDLRPVAIK
jgi:hypothetical protein